MTGFAKFLIEQWRSQPDQLPMRAVEGNYYSTLTGSDSPTIEIDWDALQKQIEEFEREFATKGKP